MSDKRWLRFDFNIFISELGMLERYFVGKVPNADQLFVVPGQ